MKYTTLLAALGLACSAIVAFAGDNQGAGRARMMERLKAADTDGNGMISKQEARALPHIDRNFDAIDANHDGQVTMEELHAFHKSQRGRHWKKLDIDGDGRISRDEAAKAPRLAEHFSAIDTNGDGFLTPEEMKAAHARRRQEAK